MYNHVYNIDRLLANILPILNKSKIINVQFFKNNNNESNMLLFSKYKKNYYFFDFNRT